MIMVKSSEMGKPPLLAESSIKLDALTIFIVALLLAGPLTNKQVEYLWPMSAEKSAILCDTLC